MKALYVHPKSDGHIDVKLPQFVEPRSCYRGRYPINGCGCCNEQLPHRLLLERGAERIQFRWKVFSNSRMFISLCWFVVGPLSALYRNPDPFHSRIGREAPDYFSFGRFQEVKQL